MIGAGVADFGRSMGEGIEKYKKRRQEYKGLQQYAAATGDIPKEVSDTMSLEQLKGQVASNEVNKAREKAYNDEQFTGLQRDAEIGRMAQSKEAERRGEEKRQIWEGFQKESQAIGPESPQEFTGRLQRSGVAPEHAAVALNLYSQGRALAPPPEVAPQAPPDMVMDEATIASPSGNKYGFSRPKAAAAPPSLPTDYKPPAGYVAVPDAKTGYAIVADRSAEAKGAPKLTADQLKNRGFASRLDLAEKEVQSLGAGGFNPAGGGYATTKDAVGWLQSGDTQRYNAASENWISAVLRRESGAAISEGERTAARNEYFPKFGDKTDTIKAKAALRQQVARDMKESGGGGEEGPAPAQAAPKAAPTEEMKPAVYLFPDGVKRRFKGGDAKDKKNWEPA